MPEEVREFLDYLERPDNPLKSSFISFLDKTVKLTREHTEWRQEYMTLEEKLREEREEG